MHPSKNAAGHHPYTLKIEYKNKNLFAAIEKFILNFQRFKAKSTNLR